MNILVFLGLGVSLGLALGETNDGLSCPPGFVEFPDPTTGIPNCLLFATDIKRRWAAARDHCMVLGSDLTNLEVSDLHQQVAMFIQEHPGMEDDGFHIGGTDEEFEGVWYWINTGLQMEMYTPHWDYGQPIGSIEQNYACILPPGHFIHSCTTDEELFTICQY